MLSGRNDDRGRPDLREKMLLRRAGLRPRGRASRDDTAVEDELEAIRLNFTVVDRRSYLGTTRRPSRGYSANPEAVGSRLLSPHVYRRGDIAYEDRDRSRSFCPRAF